MHPAPQPQTPSSHPRAVPPTLWNYLARHSLTWLVVGNAVGLWLATLLLVPDLGSWLGPLTYGRWMPLHLNLLLYGWCGLPLVGLLLRFFLPHRTPDGWPRLALGLWSGALLCGAITWLGGQSSGKLFLDWSGASRWVLAFAMGFLALVLAAAPGTPRRLGWRWLALTPLLLVPGAMVYATGPAIFPPINPESGGATGGSLLGSTLVLVVIFFLFPFVVGLKPQKLPRHRALLPTLLLLHILAWLALGGGDRSHHELAQQLGLGSLMLWIPLLGLHLGRFRWPEGSRPWLGAFAGWSLLLVTDGLVTFLPGVLERWKFTHALVAHAHLAMAGMATAFSVLVLLVLDRQSRRALTDRRAFWLWQAGCAGQIVALMTLGILEGLDPLLLWRQAVPSTFLVPLSTVDALYTLRWLAGFAMLWASWRWLWGVSKGPGTLASPALASPALEIP